MNFPVYTPSFANGGAAPATPNPTPQTGRPREVPGNATPSVAQTQQQAQQQTPQQRVEDPRPVLDMSDAALTRRDIPRGSIIDIVA